MSPTPRPDISTILAFGAHPDDVEFGCGGVLAQAAQAGANVHVVVCTRGESATHGTVEQRVREAEAGARALGASLEFVPLGEDGHLSATPAHALALAAVIRRVRPELVLAPTPEENQHPDHAVVGRLVRDAARLARYGGLAELRDAPTHAIGQLLFYGVCSEAFSGGGHGLWIDVSGVVETWRTAMSAHASQSQTRNYVDYQLNRARHLGAQAGVDYVQVLHPNDAPIFASVLGLARGARRF